MAAATLTRSENLSLGNKAGVLGIFSAVADTNTWDTGLGTVEGVFITNGDSGQSVGAVLSGGRVTFHVSGALTSPVMVLAIGLL